VNGKWILKWGVLFQRKVNGELEWFEDYGENEYGKYVGEIENWIPNGQGKQTFPDIGGSMPPVVGFCRLR